MTTIKVKRGLSANLPSLTLQAGEPAFATDTGKFYIGDGTDNVLINPDLSLPDTGTAGTYTKVTTDSKGRVTAGSSLSAPDVPTLTLSKISDAGTAAAKDTGTASGNVPIIGGDGKLDSGIMPAIAISDTFVVSSQTAMLALTAEIGDVAVRTDLSKAYILKASPASTLANWQELLTPASPVQSVAGKTGAVTLSSSDVGLGSVQNYGIASQAEAEAGTATNKYMTPQRTAQAIAAAVIDGGTF